MGTATMTAVMSANHVNLGSFSSRCWTFQRTHTSADPGGARLLGLEGRLQEELAVVFLFVGFPSLFVTPSGEQLACPMYWRGASRSTISRVFVPMFFFGQSVVVDVEGVGFRPKAVVAGQGVVALCTCIFSREYVYDK